MSAATPHTPAARLAAQLQRALSDAETWDNFARPEGFADFLLELAGEMLLRVESLTYRGTALRVMAAAVQAQARQIREDEASHALRIGGQS